jgi:hypothetical protein
VHDETLSSFCTLTSDYDCTPLPRRPLGVISSVEACRIVLRKSLECSYNFHCEPKHDDGRGSAASANTVYGGEDTMVTAEIGSMLKCTNNFGGHFVHDPSNSSTSTLKHSRERLRWTRAGLGAMSISSCASPIGIPAHGWGIGTSGGGFRKVK